MRRRAPLGRGEKEREIAVKGRSRRRVKMKEVETRIGTIGEIGRKGIETVVEEIETAGRREVARMTEIKGGIGNEEIEVRKREIKTETGRLGKEIKRRKETRKGRARKENAERGTKETGNRRRVEEAERTRKVEARINPASMSKRNSRNSNVLAKLRRH